MSDFDFDELDKAVNGAIGSDDTTAQEPVAAKPAESARSVEREVPAPSDDRSSVTPAARRAASGRFMDMVHPSSDMRSSAPVATRPVTPAPTSRLPEPPKFSQPEKTNPVVTPEVEPEIPAATDWSSPLESPFLPDAKVEKRPLGGVEPEASSPLLSSLLDEPKDELLEAPDELRLEATTLPDPIDFSPQYAPAEAEKTEEPEVSDPVDAVENEEVTPEVPEVKPEPTPAPAPEVSNTPISITQQYKEQPRAEQESGAIYDTEAYHQPIAHPGKKRSGWWIVLWIFLLVVLGAGAGAAVYLYVLPLL